MGRYVFISSLIGLLLVSIACQPELLPSAADTDDDGSAQTIPGTVSTGSVLLKVVLPASPTARIVPGDVTKVQMQITWPGGETPVLDMTRNGSAFELIVGDLPANVESVVHARALGADSQLLYEGQVTAVFAPDVQTNVVVNLVAVDKGIDEGAAPRIVAVRRPATPIQIGNIIDLEFTVGDTNDQQLAYKLESSGGSFSSASGSLSLANGTGTLLVQYTAPQVGGPTPITLKVTDDAGLATSFSFTISVVSEDVDPTPTQAAAVINFPPVIETITAVRNGRGMSLYAVVSDDGPTTGLSYRWARAGFPAASINPFTLPANTGVLPIGLTVTDSQGASSSLSFEVDTTSTVVWHLPIENQPPVIVTAVQSGNDVSYGDVIDLVLHATDPDGNPLTAEWTTDKGTLEKTVTEISGDNTIFKNRWHADVTAGTALVTVKVRDTSLAWVAYVFRINQVLGRVNIVANAGPDRQGLIGGAVLLDGSASSSEDGTIASYAWTQVSGPASTIDTPAAATTLVRPTAVGTYRYRLTVTNVNNTASDDVYVFASDPLGFMFEDAFLTDAGVIHFLNKVDRRIQRYDLANWDWLPPLETGADLNSMAVAPEGGQVYVGYTGGRMDVIDTITGQRAFFANAPETVNNMAVAESYLFTIDPTGAWSTFSLYSRKTGARTDAVEWRDYSAGIVYSRTLRRLFTFRDGTSPNDIIRTDVNLDTGKFGTHVDSPYHGDYAFVHPIRLFPDETRISVASGVIFSTSDLKYAGSFGTSYVDLAFYGKMPYIIKKIGTNTELTIMEENFAVREVRSYSGEPMRLFRFGDNMLLVTKRGARLIGIQAVLPAQ